MHEIEGVEARSEKNNHFQKFFIFGTMFLLFLTFSFSIKPEIVKAESLTDGLVGWWKFDDASGTTANDSSASNFDATLYNFPGDGSGWQDGILGGAVLFNDVLHNYAKTDNILVSNTENGSG